MKARFEGMQSERGISSLAECTENIAGFLEVLQLNWNNFNVSSRTLRRYRQQYNLPRGRLFSELTDDQLDHLISEILQVHMF